MNLSLYHDDIILFILDNAPCFEIYFVWSYRHFSFLMTLSFLILSCKPPLHLKWFSYWKLTVESCLYLKIIIYYLFLTALDLLCVWRAGASLSFRCMSFSLLWLLLLQSMGSRVRWLSSCSSRAVGYRLPSCGTCGPRSVVEPVSPESAGRFFTTGRPGKPQRCALNQCVLELWLGRIADCTHLCIQRCQTESINTTDICKHHRLAPHPEPAVKPLPAHHASNWPPLNPPYGANQWSSFPL